jgi:hypothetical protein
MEAKLKEMTPILREKRRGYCEAQRPQLTAVPQFNQIKVKPIAKGCGGPRVALNALQVTSLGLTATDPTH